MNALSQTATCKYCGLIELATKMVHLKDGEYEYACQGCAVQMGHHAH